MKTFKRILSGVLAAAMTIGAASMISVSAANVTFTDVASDHWAWTNGSIPYLVEKGVINGYKQDNGTYTFKPSNAVTRAEFIKMLDEVFGLEETTPISYSDVPSGSWFYPYFQKAAAQGYIINYGATANPDGQISREEAISLLVRYLALPANEKAESSTFADYSTISDSYKDYVLRATYAGLINGYNEDGKTYFKPQGTLTRAEALTILYRAAGCIFEASAYNREASAPDTNSVITEGGITINNVRFNGRSIVSEGADSGRITFSDCDINGTLYIRGGADVTFNDCTVENVIVYGGGDITLLDGTEIETMTLEAKSEIGAYSGTKIETLNVEYGADNTKVTGDGSLGAVTINARGFSSSMMPTEFEIGNNLTASFSNKSYEGDSDSQNAFTVAPFTSCDMTDSYINVISDVEGKIYYYYTNLSNEPTTSSFDSYYDSASYYGSFEVKAGEAESESTFSLSAVSNFKYVVLQIRDGSRKYAPVMIANNNVTGTGFTTEPYLADELTIKFKPSTSATIYWFYADDGHNLSQIEFLDIFASKESALKGSDSVTSVKSFSCALKEKYVENYSYVAFMLGTGSGVYYKPVIVSVGDNGFTDVPVVKTPGVITFKANTAGDIYYYYSETDDLPAISEFRKVYNDAEYGDRESINKNVTYELPYDEDYVDEYPYMILAIRNDDGDFLQPVVIDIDLTTGFRNDPRVESYTELRFRTEEAGKVKYYYTKTSTAPTADKFNENYGQARYIGELSVTTSYTTLKFDTEYAVTYPYMAFMFIDNSGKEHYPVVLELDTTFDTGFEFAPYAADGNIYFRSMEDGEVWYFFTDDSTTIAPEDFEDIWEDEDDYHDIVEVKGGVTSHIEIEDEILEDYAYIVIAFTSDTGSNPEFSYPFILDVEKSSLSNAGTGLRVGTPTKDDDVKITVLYSGTLYYYLTNDEDEFPSNLSGFSDSYKSIDSERKHDISLPEDDWEYVEFEGYDYMVCALKVNSTYLDYVIIHCEDGLTDEFYNEDDKTDDSKPEYDISSYGFTLSSEEYAFDSWTVKAKYDGTVSLLISEYGKVNDQPLDSKTCTAGEEVELTLPGFLTSDSAIAEILRGNVTYFIQFTDSNGDRYQPLEVTSVID